MGSVSRGVKRGRPPATGEHVGSAALRAKRLALEREELRLQVEAEVAEAAMVQHDHRAALTRTATGVGIGGGSGPSEAASSSGTTPRERRVGDLAEIAKSDLRVILEVAARSSNLKGMFIRSFKVAVASLRTVIDELGHRSTGGEVKWLEAASDRLRAEVDDLRQELSLMPSCPLTPSSDNWEPLSLHSQRSAGWG